MMTLVVVKTFGMLGYSSMPERKLENLIKMKKFKNYKKVSIIISTSDVSIEAPKMIANVAKTIFIFEIK